MLKSAYDWLIPTKVGFGNIKDAFNNVGLDKIPVTQLDVFYYVLPWDIWDELLEVVYAIAKEFKWESEKFDCDNRSTMVCVLCSLLFGVNSCGQGYGKVFDKDTGKEVALHWFNFVVVPNGKLYIFDVDNHGARSLVEKGKPIINGKWRYEITAVRFF